MYPRALQVMDAPLPKAPLDTAVVAHWLAIEGVQPTIPENIPVEGLASYPLHSVLFLYCHGGKE